MNIGEEHYKEEENNDGEEANVFALYVSGVYIAQWWGCI